MPELDNPEIYPQIDKAGLIKSIEEFPLQCERAWQEVKRVVLPSYYVKVNKIVILGMGGSAIGGDLVKALIQKKCKVPVCIIRDYELPSFVDKETLVIASSYSGNTEETLEAFSTAISKQAKLVVITTGGKLAPLANSKKIPVYKFEYETEPRQALGFLFTSLLAILNKVAVIDIKDEEFKESVLLLKALNSKIKTGIPTKQNQAKRLAQVLHNKIVVVFGGGNLKPVARRFKTQLNENAKQMAIYEELPEACHNFIVGLEFPNKLSEIIFVLHLVSKFDHPRIQARRNIISELLDKYKIPHDELHLEPPSSPLSEMLCFIYLLDYTSFYLALLNKIDPRPILNIDYLKKRLKEIPWIK